MRKARTGDLPISVLRAPYFRTGIVNSLAILVTKGFLVQERVGGGSLTGVVRMFEPLFNDLMVRVEGGIGKGHLAKAQQKDQGEDELMDAHHDDVLGRGQEGRWRSQEV